MSDAARTREFMLALLKRLEEIQAVVGALTKEEIESVWKRALREATKESQQLDDARRIDQESFHKPVTV